MKELIEQIRLKANNIPTNTKENRRAKGAYVDCLMMVKETSKNLVQPDVIKSVCKCGNELTEKEIFYETCLKCDRVV